MNLPWRIAVYVVLTVAAVFFTQRFFSLIGHESQRFAARYDRAEGDSPAPDLRSGDPGVVEGAGQSNASVESPPTVPGNTNPLPATRVARPEPPATGTTAPTGSRKGWYGALALFSLIGLGLMVGRDVSQFIGHRVQRELYGEASEPVGEREYDQAEEVWANGDHLEAIRLLREFVKKKPNKLHAAFRIAEIYEKDLGNNLAAALEYEEILKHRFDRQRWAWAAIHLVNLYNRIGQTDSADTLLRRVVDAYGDTDAAAKARQRLGLPEDATAAEPPATEETPPPAEGGFRLPPGFRPK